LELSSIAFGAENRVFRLIALRWAEKGARVFRLKPGSTIPWSENWQREATKNRNIIRKWWPAKNEYPAVGLAVVNAKGKTGSQESACDAGDA
jgi:hypothetical protein